MNEKSIYNTFSDNTVAAVRRLSMDDYYAGLLEGSRSSLCQYSIEEIHEEKENIEASVEKGRPTGKYVVEPVLVPEMWGDKLMGECFKEYKVTAHYQAYDEDDMLDLDVTFFASKEDIEQLTKVLESVANTIDFKKYSKRTSIDDWI